MKRAVSPLFAVIVIVVAVAIGVMWFVVRYRRQEAADAALKVGLQAQRDLAMRSGRPAMMRERRAARDAGLSGGRARAPVSEGESATAGESLGE